MPKNKIYYVIGQLSEGQEIVHGCHLKLSEANEQVRAIKKDGGIFDDAGIHYQPTTLRVFESREVATFEMTYAEKEKSEDTDKVSGQE